MSWKDKYSEEAKEAKINKITEEKFESLVETVIDDSGIEISLNKEKNEIRFPDCRISYHIKNDDVSHVSKVNKYDSIIDSCSFNFIKGQYRLLYNYKDKLYDDFGEDIINQIFDYLV